MTPVWNVPEVIDLVAQVTGIDADFGNCRTLGVYDDKRRLVAGLVFHDWQPEAGTIEVSVASLAKGWISRKVLREALGYAFGVAQMIVARTSEHNAAARRQCVKCGASEYVIPRLCGRHEAGVILTLTAEAWAARKLAGP